MLEFLVILKAQLSTALIISRNFLMKSMLHLMKSKNFSLGPNLENLDEFLKILPEYKNICGKVRSIKFSIKSKRFHQPKESACNDFRNKKC